MDLEYLSLLKRRQETELQLKEINGKIKDLQNRCEHKVVNYYRHYDGHRNNSEYICTSCQSYIGVVNKETQTIIDKN